MEIMKITIYGKTYCGTKSLYISKEIVYSIINNNIMSLVISMTGTKVINVINLKTNEKVNIMGRNINIDNNFHKTVIVEDSDVSNNPVYKYILNTMIVYLL